MPEPTLDRQQQIAGCGRPRADRAMTLEALAEQWRELVDDL